ncbi:MAG: hypothetical protein Q9227_004018 [Pyrenula ochraceoflavens]
MASHSSHLSFTPTTTTPTTAKAPFTSFNNSSPPRTPPSQSSRRAGTKPSGNISQIRPNLRETFLEDITPTDAARDVIHGENAEGDPHDLSLSPRHIARASMFDNMLLSLDKFSTVGNSPPIKASSTVSEIGASDSNPPGFRAPMFKLGRKRGHTFSSSVSSDISLRAEELPRTGNTGKPAGRWRNNSTSNYQTDLRRIPSDQDEPDRPTRAKISEAQRAIPRGERLQNIRTRSSRKSSKGSKSSGSSSLDLTQMIAGSRIERSEHRRSQSFDLGQRNQGLRGFENDKQQGANENGFELDAAPTPVIHAGPSRGSTNMRPPPSPGLEFGQPSVSRRNSTTSSKSFHARKPRTETLGTSIMKSREDRPGPRSPLQRSFAPSSTATPAVSQPPLERTPISQPRPGFFRRVFGSSRTLTPSTDTLAPQTVSGSRSASQVSEPILHSGRPMSPTKLQKQPQKDNSAPSSAGKDGSHTITKKPSSFFRRRKKSISEAAPMPEVLHLQPAPLPPAARDEGLKLGQPSPVSSLRMVMDPYLATPSTAGFGDADRLPIQDPASDGRASFDYEGMSARRPPVPIPRHLANTFNGSTNSLNVPSAHRNDDTFLADSSGNEDTSIASRRSSPNRQRGTIAKASRSVPESHQDHDRVWLDGNSSAEQIKNDAKPVPSAESRPEDAKASASDLSSYASASSMPQMAQSLIKEAHKAQSPVVEDVHAAEDLGAPPVEPSPWETAEKIYNHDDKMLDYQRTAAWLGDSDPEKEQLRHAYMQMYDLKDMNILVALRSLCSRMTLKGETQQVDRMLDAFSRRWCECNSNHGFKSSDVVHTICYSILLLNTDLHLADIEQKMTRVQFIRNTLPTIRRVATDSAPDAFETVKATTWPKNNNDISEPTSPSGRASTLPWDTKEHRSSIDVDPPHRLAARPIDRLNREDSTDADAQGPLVSIPFSGSIRAWESTIESVLKTIYNSISKQRLPLYNAGPDPAEQHDTSTNLLSVTSNMLRRTPSTLSKAQSEMSRGRGADTRSTTSRWTSKTRSRPRLYPMSTMGSSRTSFDEQSSVWSPTGSSTWSKASLGKTLTSMSVDSFGSEYPRGDYKRSIGFANALSQAIIREDAPGFMEEDQQQGMRALPLLEDESLGLMGAPWAKEGMLKHKQHLDGVDKRSKDRNWNECFAVIEKGWMRLFSFSVNAKSIRQRANRQKMSNVVGGGNWMENAEEIWKFLLRQTIASALPPPGYSKARPHVFALSLPTGAVHLFQVGTPDIVREFVSTANYWSARLSKEPLFGGISNIEYGWSDNIIARAMTSSGSDRPSSGGPQRSPPSSSGGAAPPSSFNTLPRPSIQSSLRSSIDLPSSRPRLPGDRIYIADWTPPSQSLVSSQLLEVDQLRALQTYVRSVEEELQKHNELRAPMLMAYSTVGKGRENREKALGNWERKSSYLLREIVKFRTYCDSLVAAGGERERVERERKEVEKESVGEEGEEGSAKQGEDVEVAAS